MNNLPVPIMDQPKALSRSEIEEIIRTQLSGLVKQEVADGMRLALINVPTLDVVQKMIDGAVNPLRENTTNQLHSVDRHLREAENRMTEANRMARENSERFQQTALDISTNVGKLVSEINAQKERLDRIEVSQEQSEKQGYLDRTEMTKALDRIDGLHADIHGDPEEPHHVSLHQLVAAGNHDRDTYHRELLGMIKPINEKLDTHDKYIASRRGLELQLMQASAKLLTNKWVIAAVVMGATGFFGMKIVEVFYQVFLK